LSLQVLDALSDLVAELLQDILVGHAAINTVNLNSRTSISLKANIVQVADLIIVSVQVLNQSLTNVGPTGIRRINAIAVGIDLKDLTILDNIGVAEVILNSALQSGIQ